mgnify:CR=1 FL=1
MDQRDINSRTRADTFGLRPDLYDALSGNMVTKDDLSPIDAMRGFCSLAHNVGGGGDLPTYNYMRGTGGSFTYITSPSISNGQGAVCEKGTGDRWGIRIKEPGAWMVVVSSACRSNNGGNFLLTRTGSEFGNTSATLTGKVMLSFSELLIVTSEVFTAPYLSSSGAWNEGMMRMTAFRVDGGVL